MAEGVGCANTGHPQTAHPVRDGHRAANPRPAFASMTATAVLKILVQAPRNGPNSGSLTKMSNDNPSATGSAGENNREDRYSPSNARFVDVHRRRWIRLTASLNGATRGRLQKA